MVNKISKDDCNLGCGVIIISCLFGVIGCLLGFGTSGELRGACLGAGIGASLAVVVAVIDRKSVV